MARAKHPAKVYQQIPETQVTGVPTFLSDNTTVQAAPGIYTEPITTESMANINAHSLVPLNLHSKSGVDAFVGDDHGGFSTCPVCGYDFPDMSIKGFREHVESCSPGHNEDGASDTSSLSEPPVELSALKGYLGFGLRKSGLVNRDESGAYDLPGPYDAQEFTSYPEDPAGGPDEDDSPDGQPKPDDSVINLRKITDPGHFINSLEGMEDMDYNKLYNLVSNAQEALVAWQNEWIDLGRIISDNHEFPAGLSRDDIEKWVEKNEPKNPRAPKKNWNETDEKKEEFMARYRDRLEAFAYGYEYNSHQKLVGRQDRLGQRLTKGRSDGRELRQRVPTQKAAEAGLSVTPETDGENGQRTTRGRRIRYDENGMDQEAGMGSRGRYQSSRLESVSRDQTPMKTFASGKKIGRPRKTQTQPQQHGRPGPSRLRELQAEHGGSADSGNNEFGENDPIQTTERWGQDSNPNSRPTTSSSMESSSFGMEDAQGQSSGKGKRRQNTSDFEDALPSNKRFGRQKANGVDEHEESTSKGGRKAAQTTDAEDSLEASAPGQNSRSDKMRTIQRESWAKDDGTRRNKLASNMKERWDRAKAEGRTGLGPSSSAGKKPEAKKVKNEPKSNDGTKVPSAASRNMLNRWAKKREAQAKGLPVPNIGRYAKEKSATSTNPGTNGTPEISNRGSSLNASAESKKRKRPAPEVGNVNLSESLATQGSGIEIPAVEEPPAKKRGRQKKDANPDASDISPSNSAAVQNQHNVTDIPQDENDVSSTSKKGSGKRGRKEPETAILPPNIADTNKNTPATASKGGRRKKAEGVTPSTSAGEPSSSQSQISSEPIATRTSGRIRRPTSRHASELAYSLPSSRHSSRSQNTVTPTPAPNNGLSPQDIKQEPSNTVIIPKPRRSTKTSGTDTGPASATENASHEPIGKRKRIARPSTVLPSTESVEVIEFDNDQEELSSSTRRAGRAQKDNAITPAPITSGPATPTDQPMARAERGSDTGSSSVSSTSGGAIVVEEKVPHHHNTTFIEEPPAKRRRGRQSVDVADALPAPSEAKKGKGKGRAISRSKKTVNEEEENAPEPEVSADPRPVFEDVAAATAAEAARQAKSEKMREIMKRRWARGDMASVMERKKANNRARKAAEAAASGLVLAPSDDTPEATPAPLADLEPEATMNDTLTPPALKARVKARKPTGAAAHKRRSGVTSENGIDTKGGTDQAAKHTRKISEYEEFQQLTSPNMENSNGRRARRPAALKAQRSFSQMDGDEDDEPADDDQEISKQFDSEYDHYQALTSPVPGVLLGKRKRKPVINLEEAMRIEAGDEVEDEFDDE